MEQRYWQAWTLSAKTTIITEVWRSVTRTLQGKALTRCFVGRPSLRWRETSATVLKMRVARSRRRGLYVRCGCCLKGLISTCWLCLDGKARGSLGSPEKSEFNKDKSLLLGALQKVISLFLLWNWWNKGADKSPVMKHEGHPVSSHLISFRILHFFC